MEARRRVVFIGVELGGGAELTAPVEKATTGLVEKATAGGRRSGEGGRPAAALERGGDVSWRSKGAMEREARWPRRHDRARSQSTIMTLW
jgi:hypothetical protein